MSDISIRPMLCKTFDENKPFFISGNPYVMEPKFDGLRCLMTVEGSAKKVTAYSRNGKPFWNIEHIFQEVHDRFVNRGFTDMVLDGELYTTDWNLSMGIVKSSKTKHVDSLKVKYHVWDLVDLRDWNAGGSEKEWRYRRELLVSIIKDTGTHAISVPTSWVYTLTQARQVYQNFIADGYEGAIIKNPDSPYNLGSRSPFWLKWKDWTDADLRIVGAVEGIGKRLGKIGALQLEGKVEWRDKSYDVVTEVGSFRCTDEQLTEMWERHKRGELVGLTAEIRFQDITVEGACRFPTFYRLREDKDVDPLDGGAAKKKRAKKVKPIILGDPELTDDYFDSLGGDSIIV
jgi:DNA ligase-1